MDTTVLEELGLTKGEIKVYISLIELGSVNAGSVVEKSELQNAVVHRAFHSLAKKGLITHIQIGKTKKYQAVEPKVFLNYLEEKKKELEKIIPELESRKLLAKKKPKAELFQGIKGLRELLRIMLDGKEYYAYGSPKKGHGMLGDFFWKNFHKIRIEKNIDGKLLFNESLKKWGSDLNKMQKTKVKFISADFEENTETIICGNKVAILIFTEIPFGFMIDDENAAKSYKNFFNMLWSNI